MPDMVKRISQIFADQVFHVPDYQRGYSWEERQWNDLLEDLELLPDGRNHFTGTLVLRARNEGNGPILDRYMKSYKAYDIIDGQQRLTTVVILLKAIHDEMQAYPQFEGLADRLQETYLHHLDRNGQPFTKLTLNADSQDFFADNILDLDPGIGKPEIRSHARLLGACNHFAAYLAHKREEKGEGYPDYLQQLYGKITLQLNMIVYPVEDELDAGTIFETMNDRGKPLTELEKVKNYLLYLSGKLILPDPHDLGQRINQTWRFIYERLMAAGLAGHINEDQLLRVHWLMAYDYDVRRWDNARSIKSRFSLRKYQGNHPALLQDLKDYLHSFQDAAAAYCEIYQPWQSGNFSDIANQDIRPQIVLWGSKLTRLGVSASFLPLLIAVRLKAGDDGTIYLKTLQLLEKYSFRVFSWRRARSNAGQTSMFQLGNRFFHSPDSDWMLEEIAKLIVYYCPDETYNERFKRETEDWFNWQDINYFLYEYEHHLAGGHPVQLTWEVLNARSKTSSIEHILPQTPQDDYWLERFTPEQRQRWTHDLANLTLTFDNSSLSNKPFPEKKGAAGIQGTYADSPLFIERALAQVPDWTVDALQARREQMVAWAQERWHVDAPVKTTFDPYPKQYTLARIKTLATEYEIDKEFQQVLDVLERHSIYPNPKVWCIVMAPPQNRNLAIGAVWPERGRLRVGIWHDSWPGYLGIPKEEVEEILGSETWLYIDSLNIAEFTANLELLLKQTREPL